MGLSRLENFLRSIRGQILYVDPNALDSTDSIENDGTSAARPFKTLQRALLESARFSYLPGPDNDKFNNTTILLYPGDHLIDNRPGWIPLSASSFLKRDGTTSADFYEFDLQTNFDITAENNALYKFNSINGGVIVPRGTSIVAMDLRKTKIRPKYVPNPENDNIERSAIFRVTGGCYFWQFTILDADPNGLCYKDYTTNTFVPNFSHHKLTTFEYADGVNVVKINDTFNNYTTNRTDLDLYYQKLGLAYGNSSGRPISPDYPSTVDIQTKIDEYRIVGSRGAEVGISSISAGNGSGGGDRTLITVNLTEDFPQLDVDTPIQVSGVGISTFNGQFIVKEVVSDRIVRFSVPSSPPSGVNLITGEGTVNIIVDTVTSASPYIFNCSLRSVYGLCGMHADGSLVDGFKSMVVAQFTGISLQKDNNAFVKYDQTTGAYVDATNVSSLYADSLAKYKPSYESYHIKASNNAFIQCVSIFAIGYAQHFEASSGGDMSITNSNSNFGARALLSKGYNASKFNRDDQGYITHIIPPKQITTTETSVEFDAIDVSKTVSVGNSSRLYLYGQTNQSIKPNYVIDGYRIGSKLNDTLNVVITQSGISTTYSSSIVMQGTSEVSYQKEYEVAKLSNTLTNNISNNIITLTASHDFINGETVRIISETGELPDGLSPDTVYYTISTGIGSTQIKLATSLDDASNLNAITIYTPKTVNLRVISRVSDKTSGDIGHPIQYDTTNLNWYISTKKGSDIYNNILSYGVTVTPRTFIKRIPDKRSYEETIYKVRYVIPKTTSIKARPPLDGFVVQDSTNIPTTSTEIDYLYSPSGTTKSLASSSQLRSVRFISDATYVGTTATIETELPHYLSVGSEVSILNVLSSNNPTGVSTSGYNGTYTITAMPSRRKFSYTLSTNPGTFLDNTSTRTSSLPYFSRKKLSSTFVAYRTEKIQDYVQNKQDGIYHISLINSSNSPSVAPFTDLKLFQPIQNIYPQLDRDNATSDPEASRCFALPNPIGQVVVNDSQKSITKETLDDFLSDNRVGFGITNIVSNSVGTSHTFFTNIEHGLNPITAVTITSAGSNYGSTAGASGSLYNASLIGGSGEGASAAINVTSGSISGIEIIDGGSDYQVGDVLTVVGVATTSSHVPGTVTVSSIYDHTGEVICISGINDRKFTQYNTLYRITGISSSRAVQVSSAGSITSPSVSGFGITVTSSAIAYLSGKSLTASTFSYNNISGNATLTFGSAHGLLINEKIRISGANSSLYNGDFLISKINSLTSFDINVGVSTNVPSTAGTIIVHPYGYSSQGGSNSGKTEERLIEQYDGIFTTLSGAATTTVSSISVTNILTSGLKIGDYIKIDDEILRIKETTSSGNPIDVFRGLMGTRSSAHVLGAVVKKIHLYPIEFRRYSILRASGHTFEYVGFGPGNYSNAFPERQDRQISNQEKLLSQSFRSDGGINVYTGMNNDGDFYIGNKRVNSATGQEDTFDSPVPSVRGEEFLIESGSPISIVNAQNITAFKSIKVDGGPNNNNLSEFNGPVVFNEKITSTSLRGIESNSLYLQGNATISRNYTVGISTPTSFANSGDVAYYSQPDDGGYLGWVYTSNNSWRKFGPIQNSLGRYEGVWSGTFYGDGSNLSNLDSVWGELSSSGINTAYYLGNVGIGTSIVRSDYKLRVDGKTYINGVLNVTEIIEKATIVNTSWPGGSDINLYLGDNNVYYYLQNASSNWTINFTGNSSGATLNQLLETGDSITVAFMATMGSTPYYNSTIKVDGVVIIPKWYGGFAPTSGNANSIDTYTYVIIKTGSGTFTVLASQSQYK